MANQEGLKLGILISLLLFIQTFVLFGQKVVVIKGKVIDANGVGIDVAIVTAHAVGRPNLNLSYAITDNEGNFSLKFFQIPDSIQLSCSHISYATISEKIISDGQEVLLNMKYKSNTLQEIEVKANRFRRNSDTLYFDVARMQKINDQTIEDVLKRIPGIEISVSGAIFYDGIPINKFYIEGIDMLEGNYTIASKNLRAQLIDEVQILERHQPITALNNIIKPPNAAINLRLKSGVAIVNNLDLGLGVADELKYSGDMSSFRFAKEHQSSVIANVNNIGKATDYLFRDHFNLKLTYDDLNLSRVLLPNIGPEFYTNNEEQAINFTKLKKLSNEKQLKVIAGGNHNIDLLLGENIRTWELENPVQFVDSIQNRGKDWQVSPKFIYEYNGQKKFSKWQLDFSGNLERHKGNQAINNAPIEERLVNDIYGMNISREFVKTKGFKAIRIVSKLNYDQRTDDMIITPSIFIDQSNRFFDLESSRQIVKTNTFSASSNSAFYQRFKKILIQIPAGINGKITKFNSVLSEVDGQTERSLGQDFENDQMIYLLQPHAKPNATINIKQWEIAVDFPLKYNLNYLSFKPETMPSNKISGFSGELITNVNRMFQNGHRINFKYRYENGFGTLRKVYNGYLLSGYQYLNRNENLNIYRVKGHEISLNYQLKNIQSGTVFDISTAANRRQLPVIDQLNIGSQGVSNQVSLQDNVQDHLSLAFLFSKDIFQRTTILKQKILGGYQINKSIINFREVNLSFRTISSNTSLEYINRKWGNSISSDINYSDNNFGRPQGFVDLKYGLFVKTSTNSDLSVDYTLNKTSGKTKSVNFINVFYKHKLVGKIGEIKVGFTNLTNVKRYLSIDRTGNYLQQSQIRLRPRQIFLQMSYNW